MTPLEAWQLPAEKLPSLSDEVIILRLQYAVGRIRELRTNLPDHASLSYPEALKRPACVAKLVEWKLQGLI